MQQGNIFFRSNVLSKVFFTEKVSWIKSMSMTQHKQDHCHQGTGKKSSKDLAYKENERREEKKKESMRNHETIWIKHPSFTFQKKKRRNSWRGR